MKIKFLVILPLCFIITDYLKTLTIQSTHLDQTLSNLRRGLSFNNIGESKLISRKAVS